MSERARPRTRASGARHRLVAYAPALLWAIILLWMGGQSTGRGLPLPGLDKVAHFLIYGALGLLAGWGWRRAGGVPHSLLVIALACAVGAIDELHQRSVSTRTADPFDFIADAAGVVLGFAAGRGRPGLERKPDPE